MKKLFIFTLGIIASVTLSYAQKKNIVLHYDFQKVEGNIVRDRSPHHADARLMNGAAVQDGSLVLEEKDAYLDMTAKAGEIVKSLSDFTIYARYFIAPEAKIKGYGYFLWCFSALEANKEKDGPYHAYRINEQRVETSIGGWSQETGIQVSRMSEQGKWITVLFRQSGSKGELFIDGNLIGTEQGFPVLSTNFSSAPLHNWIGRAPFAGDNYLKQAKVSDFRIYNKSLSDKEMKTLTKN